MKTLRKKLFDICEIKNTIVTIFVNNSFTQSIDTNLVNNLDVHID